jgi:hypothetical protein
MDYRYRKLISMARRFNNLNAALKYLRPPGATEESVIPDAPAGSQLKKYQDFKAGKQVINIVRAADSLPGNIKSCALKAFGEPVASTDKFLVDISGRALTKIADTGVTEAILNIDATPEGVANLEREVGFVPARATISIVPSGAGTNTPSKITGDNYKKKATKTYTFPFGAGTDTPSYKQTKAAILAAVASDPTKNRGVSFKPEKY